MNQDITRSARGSRAAASLARFVALASLVLALLTSGCTTVNGERPGFLGAIGQGLGAAGYGVGMVGIAKGVPGAESVAKDGIDLMSESMGVEKK